MFIKRLTTGLLGLAIAGIFILTCEKMDGPEPPFLCARVYNQLFLIDAAGAPIGEAIPFNTFNRLVISDGGAWLVPGDANGATGDAVEMPGARKIIFQ